MNSPIEDVRAMQAGRQAEETLRIIAALPAPAGLEDRVQQALRKGPGRARVLSWPLSRQRWAQSGIARGAAAAAIVFVVVGVGWGVYSRVRPYQAPRVIVMPHVAAPGGFSSAGAMRTPQTLNRPVLAHPVVPAAAAEPAVVQAVPAQPATNVRSMPKQKSAPKSHRQVKAATATAAAQ